jgi:hypothetical protein
MELCVVGEWEKSEEFVTSESDSWNLLVVIDSKFLDDDM